MTFKTTRREMMLGTLALSAAPLILPRASFAQEGDTLHIRLLEDVNIFDPAFYTAESELWVIDSIYPKLAMFKAGREWEWEPYSAEKIDQIDPTTIGFTLKKGLKWTNGYGEVTAEDVKYSYERYINKELNPSNGPNWSPLDHVEVTGKYTGLIHLKKPYAGLFGYVLPYDGGQIVCKKAMEEAGGKIGSEVPTTAGPYKIVEHRSGARTVLERDENWEGPKPAFKRVEMLPITDAKAAENGVLAGDLDWSHISLSAVSDLKQSSPENLKLDIRETPNFAWIGANMKNPALQDERVRKAIQMAVDRDAILEGAYFNIAKPAYGIAEAGRPGYTDTPPIERDIAGAKDLIDAAGASGTTLRLDVVADPDKITAAQIIQANLAEIGLNVSVNQHEAGAFWSLPAELGEDLQLFYIEWILTPPDMNWVTQYMVSEQAGIWNWQYFENPEFDKLQVASSAELDPEKRNALLLKMQKLLDESYSIYVVTRLPRAVLWNKDVVIPSMTPAGAPKLGQFKKA